jgi:hypothetical protein
MVYSDTTNLVGIIQEEERLTGLGYAAISGSTTNLKEFTSLNNIVSHRIWHTIFTSNGNWQYDDSNKSDLPAGATSLVSGTATYALPTDALTVKRIEVKDANGEWSVLTPITLEEIDAKAETLTDQGTPRFYRLIGQTIELFPTPNYASSGGLKPYFDRDCVEFATTDTTKTPGFASPYHSIIALGGAMEWLKVHTPTSAQLQYLREDYAKMEKNLKEFYGMRFKAKKPMVGRAYSSYK